MLASSPNAAASSPSAMMRKDQAAAPSVTRDRPRQNRAPHPNPVALNPVAVTAAPGGIRRPGGRAAAVRPPSAPPAPPGRPLAPPRRLAGPPPPPVGLPLLGLPASPLALRHP